MNAREKAEGELKRGYTYTGTTGAAGKGAGVAGKRIGWALLDLADAVRELADAAREVAQARRPIVNYYGLPPTPPAPDEDPKR